MPVAAPPSLREGDRAQLEALARSTSARASVAHRARIVLMSAEGRTNTEIARLTGSSRPTVINWRNRYAAGGISALGDLPRSGRPAVVDELEVVATTLADGGRPPEHLGVDHWSSRLLGKQLGISFATVARIWRKWGIRPHRVETFTLAAHPTVEAQARGVVVPYPTSSERRAETPHRPALEPGVGARPADPPDPWLNLVEVSLAVITQQAIRRGTYASVHHLIEAIGALTDGWHDRHEPSGRAGAGEAIIAKRDREVTSHTHPELRQRSSRVAESGPVRDLDRSVRPSRDSMPVRAEFHGARGRRSGTRKRVSG